MLGFTAVLLIAVVRIFWSMFTADRATHLKVAEFMASLMVRIDLALPVLSSALR